LGGPAMLISGIILAFCFAFGGIAYFRWRDGV
jgi:hypothetical protein